jgi:uncharacterized protein
MAAQNEHHEHKEHPEIVSRLKRAHGHLAKVIRMIDEKEPCLQVAQQLHAVSHAVENAKRAFVQHHIEDCLDDSMLDARENRKKHLEEFREITKYL